MLGLGVKKIKQGQMKAVLTMGFGGIEQLAYREDVPVPHPAKDEVLIKVGACGLNNTDIWTREGKYGGSVDLNAQGGWKGEPFHFPRIQGADIVGQIVEVGENISSTQIGKRVMVNPTLYKGDSNDSIYNSQFIGSERDGGFAEFVTVPMENVIPIQSPLSDAELATFMVSYMTAEHMLNRGQVTQGQTVLVTGASGGVGSAALQLAKRRGAKLIGMVNHGKESMALKFGADHIIHRGGIIRDELNKIDIREVDMVIDIVAGDQVNDLLEVLRPGGKLVIAGAIAGPVTKIDWRKVYLKYLDILGSTLGTMEEAKDIVRYIERGEIKPVLHKAYSLHELAQAQVDFMNKKHFGKLSIIP